MLIQRALFIVLALSLLSGCAGGFKDYFKKSANNKLIDSKGFEGSKRRPLYNKKYIALAKKRVANDEIDEDLDDYSEDDQIENIPSSSKLNRQMYLEMAKSDNTKQSRFKKYQEQYNVRGVLEDDSYPALPAAHNKATFNKSDDNALRKELDEIKSMLNDTRRELTKRKCPIQTNIDNNKKPLLKEKFTDPVLQEELKKLPPPRTI